MFTRRLLLSIGLMLVTPGVVLAAPHPATYAKRVGTLGVRFEINGQAYKLVRVPFKAFDGGKYAIVYPKAIYLNSSGFKTAHSDKPLVSNATISGFPAYLSSQDSRSYDFSGAIGKSASLDVRGIAIGTVAIQVGTTLVSVRLFQVKDPTDSESFIEVGEAVDVRAYAEWATWRDLKAEATAVDTLIDYIQIIPL